MQGVFWKDNAEVFPNQLSKIHLQISKLLEIALKDKPNFKKDIGKPSLEAILAKFNK